MAATDLTEIYRTAGLPGEIAEAIADADRGLARGELFTGSDDLRTVIGRPTTTLSEALAAAW